MTGDVFSDLTPVERLKLMEEIQDALNANRLFTTARLLRVDRIPGWEDMTIQDVTDAIQVRLSLLVAPLQDLQ
jgi:hypothetical protein